MAATQNTERDLPLSAEQITPDAPSLTPVGIIESPFKEKFAIPRQPGIVSAAKGRVVLQSPFDHPDTVRGIDQFSHLWLIFEFHQTKAQGWTRLVRPPRLGGNKKIGVFATRSTFRPNAIGMSVVKLDNVEIQGGKVALAISGMDLVDGTPILDIKPYIPYSDAIVDAEGGYAQESPETDMQVSFSTTATRVLQQHYQDYPQLTQLIEQLLLQDPRPAYKRNKPGQQHYGVKLYEFDVAWQVEGNHSLVTDITKV